MSGGGCSPVYCVVIQEKGQPDITDRSYSGWHNCACVRKREREGGGGGVGQTGRSTDRMTIHMREQASVASLACFPKHNLTACPLELRLPLQEKTKQT